MCSTTLAAAAQFTITMQLCLFYNHVTLTFDLVFLAQLVAAMDCLYIYSKCDLDRPVQAVVCLEHGNTNIHRKSQMLLIILSRALATTGTKY